MSLETAGFWVLAVLLLGSSLGVVLSKNLFHAVLWLALALVATAGVFLLLAAEFLAAVQILLYAGGVVTVVVFAIMLTERLVGARLAQMNRGLGAGAAVSAAVFAGLAALLLRADLPATPAPVPPEATLALGEALLTRYVLPFELLAILFVAALLGALYFARREE